MVPRKSLASSVLDNFSTAKKGWIVVFMVEECHSIIDFEGAGKVLIDYKEQ